MESGSFNGQYYLALLLGKVEMVKRAPGGDQIFDLCSYHVLCIDVKDYSFNAIQIAS